MITHILISVDGLPLANKAAEAGIALAHALGKKDVRVRLERVRQSLRQG